MYKSILSTSQKYLVEQVFAEGCGKCALATGYASASTNVDGQEKLKCLIDERYPHCPVYGTMLPWAKKANWVFVDTDSKIGYDLNEMLVIQRQKSTGQMQIDRESEGGSA